MSSFSDVHQDDTRGLLAPVGSQPYPPKRLPLRVLATVTFNRNQLLSHLEPLFHLGAEVTLVTDRAPTPPVQGLDVVVPPRVLSRVFGRAAAKLIMCLIVARRLRPDWVMGFNLVPHGLNALATARLSKSKVLYHQIGGAREWRGGGWDSDNRLLGRLPRRSRSLEWLLLRAIRRMDVVAVMGSRARDEVVAAGVNAKRVAVVPGAISGGEPQVDVEEPCFDLVTVGALLPNKRIEDLLAVVHDLRNAGVRVTVAVVGVGPLMDNLRNQSRDWEIEDSVEFLGFRTDVREICGRARVFVLCSASEGLSLAMVDAMARGVPPVVSDVGEARDVVVHGASGFLYPAGDREALKTAVRELLTHPHLRDEMGRTAREHSHQWANVGRVAEVLRQALYDEH